jgi:kynurenine formamidase
MGPADVIDVSALSGTGEHGFSPTIPPGRVQAWEERHGPIAAGDVVLLYSGWDRYYQPGPEGQKYAHDALVCGTAPGWPVPEPATIDYLHTRGVRCVGTDGVSIGGPRGGAPPHVAGLSKGMAYVELLTNLGRLPARGAYFLFLPVKVAGSSGGPGRAIAFVPRV